MAAARFRTGQAGRLNLRWRASLIRFSRPDGGECGQATLLSLLRQELRAMTPTTVSSPVTTLRVSLACCCLLVLAAGSLGLAASASAAAPPEPQPLQALADGQASAAALPGLPIWSGQATDPRSGVSYPFTMIGGDPAQGGTTTVPTLLVPLAFRFHVSGDGQAPASLGPELAVTLDASGAAQETVASPLFTSASFPLSGDEGQYADVIQRAQFDQVGSGWHTVLGTPTVMDTVTINVPPAQGFATLNTRGVIVGRVDHDWLAARLHALLGGLAGGKGALDYLPIFESQDVLEYLNGDPTACCVIGWHGASNGSAKSGQPAFTYVYSAYLSAGSFKNRGLADIHILSHELIEWLDDPFASNQTAAWSAPGYACSTLLEVGDPLVGTWFPVAGSHPEDVAFVSWFAQQSPSSSFQGRYSYMGSDPVGPQWTTPNPGCA